MLLTSSLLPCSGVAYPLCSTQKRASTLLARPCSALYCNRRIVASFVLSLLQGWYACRVSRVQRCSASKAVEQLTLLCISRGRPTHRAVAHCTRSPNISGGCAYHVVLRIKRTRTHWGRIGPWRIGRWCIPHERACQAVPYITTRGSAYRAAALCRARSAWRGSLHIVTLLALYPSTGAKQRCIPHRHWISTTAPTTVQT